MCVGPHLMAARQEHPQCSPIPGRHKGVLQGTCDISTFLGAEMVQRWANVNILAWLCSPQLYSSSCLSSPTSRHSNGICQLLQRVCNLETRVLFLGLLNERFTEHQRLHVLSWNQC